MRGLPARSTRPHATVYALLPASIQAEPACNWKSLGAAFTNSGALVMLPNPAAANPELGHPAIFAPVFVTYQAVLYGPGNASGPPVMCKQRVRVWPPPS